MKKILGIIVAICLMATMLCVAVFAADAPASDVVLCVSALKKDGTTVVLGDYKDFAEGWEAAIDLGENKKEMKNNSYYRVVVDLYADWNANEDGEFGKSGDDGFQFSTIYVPDDVKITINMNGHTINRGRKEWEYDGEVIYIDEDADVIINDGTITGGWSCNGAGGIHIHDADVTLNNVNVNGNAVEDDKGAGIALYDGANLTMNGGSISNNRFYTSGTIFDTTEGALFVEDSTAVLNNVTIRGNNPAGDRESTDMLGAAVSMNGRSKLTLNGCLVEDNAYDLGTDLTNIMSIFYADDEDCTLILNDTVIRNNGTRIYEDHASSGVFAIYGKLTINRCTITGNKTRSIFFVTEDAPFSTEVVDTVITDNDSRILGYDFGCPVVEYNFVRCTFNNNNDPKANHTFMNEVVSMKGLIAKVTFYDCDLGNSTFDKPEYYTIVDTSETETDSKIGSMLGQGNVAMIFSLVAVFAACAAIGIVITKEKKKDSILAKLLAAAEGND